MDKLLQLLTVVDWIIIVVITASTLISLMRGFVKEALSLATLVIAVVISRMFGNEVSTLLVDHISVPSVRLVVAYSGLFIVTMTVGGMVNHLISHLVQLTGLSGTDRFLGMIFGLGRGALIVIVAIGVMARLPVTEDPWWRQSTLIPHFAEAAETIQSRIFGSVPADAPGAET